MSRGLPDHLPPPARAMTEHKVARAHATKLTARANPASLHLVDAIAARPSTVGELATRLRMPFQTVSHHLGFLRAAGQHGMRVRPEPIWPLVEEQPDGVLTFALSDRPAGGAAAGGGAVVEVAEVGGTGAPADEGGVGVGSLRWPELAGLPSPRGDGAAGVRVLAARTGATATRADRLGKGGYTAADRARHPPCPPTVARAVGEIRLLLLSRPTLTASNGVVLTSGAVNWRRREFFSVRLGVRDEPKRFASHPRLRFANRRLWPRLDKCAKGLETSREMRTAESSYSRPFPLTRRSKVPRPA
ncbi:ArsR family transcriptional regulator [Limnoglobus roseus]|uniref:ArsR family transcriptional regulator n=1 Tax=Limnoglobus roseus TaxID=2598579 RepID=A0A5C1AE40_9BACT|nr:ArsR family transcriptional regulator [Limnoglobus roseus]